MAVIVTPGKAGRLLRAPRTAGTIPPAPLPEVVPQTAAAGPGPRGRRTPRPRSPRVLAPRTSRVLAVVFAVAWVTCPAIEPVPNGPAPDYELWQLPVDVFAVAGIVAAVVALWAAHRWGPRLGVLAGIGMLAETALCPGSGHHVVGWYTWVQAALSVGVLVTSAALLLWTSGRARTAGSQLLG